MSVRYQTKRDNNMDVELKQFYSSSQTYLERLKKHDEEHFASYIELCKRLIPKGSSILDCGCGIGLSSYLLANAGLRVTATDISPLFISEAKKRYANKPKLRFFVGDAIRTSFRNQSFDAVCSYDLLEHVTDVKGVLKEIYRIIRKGGRLVIFTPNHLDPIEHLIVCILWKTKRRYKPWEARSRMGAFYQFIKTTFLSIEKAIGINKKIYYLQCVLSDSKNACGDDFDATWLTNWFDIENTLREIGFHIEDTLPRDFRGKVMRIMRILRIPKAIQSFYVKMRVNCIIVTARK